MELNLVCESSRKKFRMAEDRTAAVGSGWHGTEEGPGRTVLQMHCEATGAFSRVVEPGAYLFMEAFLRRPYDQTQVSSFCGDDPSHTHVPPTPGKEMTSSARVPQPYLLSTSGVCVWTCKGKGCPWS